MPKFDRSVLAKFLPDPRAIADFEKLNTAVDVVLPRTIEESNSLASQANSAANQALARLDELTPRVDAMELLPTLILQPPPDNLAPPSIPEQAANDLAPTSFSAGPVDSLAPV